MALLVATTPTACGIETPFIKTVFNRLCKVATTPTACGIETQVQQQPLSCHYGKLQQHLPLAVLKLLYMVSSENIMYDVATTPTACGIETPSRLHVEL